MEEQGVKTGTTIVIQGLKAKGELNGRRAVVLSYLPERERYQVGLTDGSGSIAIKESNMEIPTSFSAPTGSTGVKKMTAEEREWAAFASAVGEAPPEPKKEVPQEEKAQKKQEDKEVAGTPKATTSKPEAPKVEEVVSSPTQTMKGLQRAEIVRHSGEIFRAAVESERWEHCHGQRPQGKGGSQRENVSPSL